MISASYYLLAAVGILGTVAYAAHEVHRGNWTPLFGAVVLYGIYAVVFLADAVMQWRASRRARS